MPHHNATTTVAARCIFQLNFCLLLSPTGKYTGDIDKSNVEEISFTFWYLLLTLIKHDTLWDRQRLVNWVTNSDVQQIFVLFFSSNFVAVGKTSKGKQHYLILTWHVLWRISNACMLQINQTIIQSEARYFIALSSSLQFIWHFFEKFPVEFLRNKSKYYNMKTNLVALVFVRYRQTTLL